MCTIRLEPSALSAGFCMNYQDRYLTTLSDLGLSSSQAKIFLTLAKFQMLNARSISKLTGITRSDVYRVFNELEAAGLVERIIAKPEKFKARPPEECISTLLQRRINKTRQIVKEATELTNFLNKNFDQIESDEKLGFILLTGRNAIYAKVGKMFQEVQQTVYFLGLPPRRLMALFTNCLPALENALERGVKCKVVMKKPEEGLQKPLRRLIKGSNFNLRYVTEQPKTVFSIWDNKDALLGTSQEDAPSPTPILWSNNTSIVTLGKEYFEKTWEMVES